MDIVIGSQTNPIATTHLVGALNELHPEGTFYTAYPILATLEGEVTIDAVLVSPRFGLVVFQVPSIDINDEKFYETVREDQTNIYFVVTQKLREHKGLRSGRKLEVEPIVVSYIPGPLPAIQDDDEEPVTLVNNETIHTFFADIPHFDEQYYRPLNAALQRVATIKPAKKRITVKKEK